MQFCSFEFLHNLCVCESSLLFLHQTIHSVLIGGRTLIILFNIDKASLSMIRIMESIIVRNRYFLQAIFIEINGMIFSVQKVICLYLLYLLVLQYQF